MATHSSTLAWKIPWTKEPGRLQSMGSRRVGYDRATSLSLSLSLSLSKVLSVLQAPQGDQPPSWALPGPSRVPPFLLETPALE